MRRRTDVREVCAVCKTFALCAILSAYDTHAAFNTLFTRPISLTPLPLSTCVVPWSLEMGGKSGYCFQSLRTFVVQKVKVKAPTINITFDVEYQTHIFLNLNKIYFIVVVWTGKKFYIVMSQNCLYI